MLCYNVASMKLLVVDDHPVLRDGLAALLRQMGPETVVLQAGDAAQALTLVAQHADLDAVVLDIAMPGIDGFRAITEFGRLRPELPIVVLSSSESADDVRHALSQGALGYVPKSASQKTLISAIRLVLNGELYVPPLILAEAAATRSTVPPTDASSARAVLTDRQIDVLRRVCEGASNRTIAIELGLSEKTVKAHISAIFKALNVVNRTQAAAAARKADLI
jgi:two-component system, NarL family, nitrate/nitrite response regulator NarL